MFLERKQPSLAEAFDKALWTGKAPESAHHDFPLRIEPLRRLSEGGKELLAALA